MKTLSLAVITGLLLAVSAPAFAQDAPKTKAECDKAKGGSGREDYDVHREEVMRRSAAGFGPPHCYSGPAA